MESVERFRSTTTRYVGLAAMVFAAAGLVLLVVEGAWSDLAKYTGPLGLIGLFGLAAMWLPYVDVTDGGVEMRNILRTVRVPWPAVQDIDGRYGLRLTTAYGKLTAWAAPAPAGRQRMLGGDSEAAALVRRRLDRLQALGHLADPRLERPAPVVTWHFWIVGTALALALLTVATVFAG